MITPAGPASAVDLTPLRSFVNSFGELLARTESEEALLKSGLPLLARLVLRDGWLPDAFARPSPDRYQQYLLHCDSRERFSVVSFVWGPDQSTPIHDHRVWGLVGVLRGREQVRHYGKATDGALHPIGPPVTLHRGEVEGFGPLSGDIHQVSNGLADAPSVSIHVYGGNIGAVQRATYDETGREKPFVSGYANEVLPNFWG